MPAAQKTFRLSPDAGYYRPQMGERHGLKYLWRTMPRAPQALFRSIRDLHPAMVQVMYGRGLQDPDVCLDFLAGICRDPDDPYLLADLPRAIQRLVQAKENHENVAVFTDYDADGVNSAAVLSTGLRMVGIEPRVRIPNRFLDGYYDQNAYLHAPLDYLQGLGDAWFLDRLRRNYIVLAVGNHDPLFDQNVKLAHWLGVKNIPHALDVWEGFGHDWPWWHQMAAKFFL